MILFKDDWAKYPNAIVHYRTRNKSFLELAEKHKRMGIKNYAFHLCLLQKELEDVDPHDPNLTPEQMTLIGLECLYNPWYFFREVLRIPPQASANSIPFRANRGNISLIWLFFNHIDVGLTQPRQTGKSVSVDGLVLYLLVIGSINTRINMLTLNDKLRTANVLRIKRMRKYLPEYLRQEHKHDADNTVELSCVKRTNLYSTAVGQNSESAALTVARGLTAPIGLVDEPPFIDYIDITIPAMLSAGNAARDEARSVDAPYGNIFTTTAGKRDTKSGKYIYELFHNGMRFSEAVFDLENVHQLVKVIDKKCGDNKPICTIIMSHRQLGYTDEWLRQKMRETNSKGDDADRDYLNRWTVGGLRSPLPTELLERIRGSQRDPDYVEISSEGYMTNWYIPKSEIAERMRRSKIIGGMDLSEGIGRDAITLVLVDPKTLEVLATTGVNETNIIRFTGWVADLMEKYENIILIPERKNMGTALIDTLLIRLPAAGIDPFKRIYNLIVDEHKERTADYAYLLSDMGRRPSNWNDKNKKEFGFATAGTGRHSRESLYQMTLQRAAALGGDKCHDVQLIDEICGLASKNGRIDHADKGHDDMAIGWLLAVWFLTSSKNLQYYGITNALAGTREYRIGESNKVVDDNVVRFEEHRQRTARAEMERLLVELRTEKDERIIRMTEMRIRALDSRLLDQYDDAQTIDALISNAAESRSRRVRENAHDRQRRAFRSAA